jgi:hypothetical protein
MDFDTLAKVMNKFNVVNKVIPSPFQETANRFSIMQSAFKKVTFPYENIFKTGLESYSTVLDQIRNVTTPYILSAFEKGTQFEQAYQAIRQNQFKYKQFVINMWNDFENELKTKNRYFPKSEFINVFEKYAKVAKYPLKKGSVLYRARKIEVDELSCEVNNIIKTVTDDTNNSEQINMSYKYKDIWDYIREIPSERWEWNFIDNLNLRNFDFWGFDEKSSGAPPSKSTTHGRANPPGISYLYTARDDNTAISEVQPTIEQLVSIAKIITTKKLNLFSFDVFDALNSSDLKKLSIVEVKEYFQISSFWEFEGFFRAISELYSKPILGNTDNYYATQYLSEYIKNLGFAGIKYKSSLKKTGTNIVLFATSKDDNGNPNNYKILSSSLHIINNVKVTSRLILPKENSKKN